MSYNVLEHNTCIEIDFYIDGNSEYISCCLGKLPTYNEINPISYWYGLVPDGSQAYDFNTLEEFINAPVFGRNSLSGLWDRVTICAIDGCDVEYRLDFYINN